MLFVKVPSEIDEFADCLGMLARLESGILFVDIGFEAYALLAVDLLTNGQRHGIVEIYAVR